MSTKSTVDQRREESPSETEGIQSAYRTDLEGRLRELRSVIRETISENDALRLGERYNQDEPDPKEDFEEDTRTGKQLAFFNQLQEWIEDGFLEPVNHNQIINGRHYTAVYADMAYQEGVGYADGLLRRRGGDPPDEDVVDVVGRPIHIGELEEIYTRNYKGLTDISEDAGQSVSEVLTRGLAEGYNPRRMADEMTKEVRDIQKSRARVIARTETLNAHNSASLQRYEEFGIDRVNIITHTPCPICEHIEQEDPYKLENAPRLPLDSHPNCVCTYGPVV